MDPFFLTNRNRQQQHSNVSEHIHIIAYTFKKFQYKKHIMRFFSENNTNKLYDDDVIVDSSNCASTNTAEHDEDRDDATTLRQVSGAAVVGGIVGCCLMGPFLGLIAAGGAAALATSKGAAGTVARSTGDVAADAGVRLKKIDEKHHIVEKTSQGIVNGCRWVSDQLKDKPAASTKRRQDPVMIDDPHE